MRFRHMLGWIGRNKRQECADVVSALIVQQLIADPTKQSITVPVASRSHLRAFGPKPLAPSVAMQANKLKDRINNRIWKELKDDASATVNVNTKNGRVTHLVVVATRLKPVAS